MDPLTLIVIGAAAAAAVLIATSKRDEPSQSERTRDEVRRVGDTTVDRMRRKSSEFRDHIDRETRR